MKKEIIEELKKIIKKIKINTSVELTSNKIHGDYSTNIALKAAKQLKKSPIEIARQIVKMIKLPFVDQVKIEGAGFINFFLKTNYIQKILENIINQKTAYGQGNQGKFINVEYVSANPTGYLHIGHARGAALGSALVNVLKFAGNKVDAEYYINDSGNQINILGRSTFIRYLELFHKKVIWPKDAYKGEEIKDVAKKLKSEFGDKYISASYDDVDVKNIFQKKAKDILLQSLQKHLQKYNVHFDIWTSESSVIKQGAIESTLQKLGTHIYKKDGAIWLRTTSAGDEKDRVLIKSDESLTYIVSDIAYHHIKIKRGYDELINVWGADHVGYTQRMGIALEYLGLPSDKLDIIIVQLVKLFQKGQEVKMSKRKGHVYWLKDIIDDVGLDAARWFMLERANNSEIVFDIEQAVTKSVKNPVFHVQYTHARANSLIKKSHANINLTNLNYQYNLQEKKLINYLSDFPEIILLVANTHKINLLTKYLLEVAQIFNSFYSAERVIGSEKEAILIQLTQATQIVLRNGLNLLGISAPSAM